MTDSGTPALPPGSRPGCRTGCGEGRCRFGLQSALCEGTQFQQGFALAVGRLRELAPPSADPASLLAAADALDSAGPSSGRPSPPGGEPARLTADISYYRQVIAAAARQLRTENIAHLLATDLEDSLSWSTDPDECAHPYSNCHLDGRTFCRHCGSDTSDLEGIGS